MSGDVEMLKTLLAEARAEVERLTRERDEVLITVGRLVSGEQITYDGPNQILQRLHFAMGYREAFRLDIETVQQERDAALARAESAEARERVLREVLGEIGTACEDKALRAYPVQDTSGSKRQKIIDYVHGVARAALGEGESRG